jgi:hypothetical protein
MKTVAKICEVTRPLGSNNRLRLKNPRTAVVRIKRGQRMKIATAKSTKAATWLYRKFS